MAGIWLQLVFGVWLIISPWLLGVGGNVLMLWNSVIVGLLLVLTDLWLLFGHGGDEYFGAEEHSRAQIKK